MRPTCACLPCLFFRLLEVHPCQCLYACNTKSATAFAAALAAAALAEMVNDYTSGLGGSLQGQQL